MHFFRKISLTVVSTWLAIGLLFWLSYLIQQHLLAEYFYWDTEWALAVAKKMYAGKKYYYDFFETNPPLIFVLYIPFVAFAQIVSVEPVFFVQIFFYALIAVFLCLNLVLLKKIFPDNRGMVYFVLLMIAFGELFVPADAFTEREHLTVILFFPYLLILVQRCQADSKVNWPWAAFVGFFMAIGVCLKPYFLIPLVFIEIYHASVRKKITVFFRLETWVIFIFGLFYLFGVYIYFPEFYLKILPLVNSFYVPFFSTIPMIDLLKKWPLFLMINLVICFLFNQNKYKHYFNLVGLSALGFLIVYLVAKQNWYYHLYPAFTLTTIAFVSKLFFAVSSRAYEEKIISLKIKNILVIIFGIYFFIFVLAFFIDRAFKVTSKHASFRRFLEPSIQYYCKNKPENVLILSPYFHPYQIIMACPQTISTARFPVLMFLPGMLYLKETHQKQPPAINNFLNMLHEDIKKRPPSIIFLDEKGVTVYINKKKETKPVLSLLLSDPVFAQFFSHYQRVKKMKDFSVYIQKANVMRSLPDKSVQVSMPEKPAD